MRAIANGVGGCEELFFATLYDWRGARVAGYRRWVFGKVQLFFARKFHADRHRPEFVLKQTSAVLFWAGGREETEVGYGVC